MMIHAVTFMVVIAPSIQYTKGVVQIVPYITNATNNDEIGICNSMGCCGIWD